MKTSTKILSLLLIGGLAVIAAASQMKADETPTRDGVFIHITQGPDNAHRVLMALQMASIMADSRDILVYLDIDGVHNVLDGAPDMTYKHFPSSHTQIESLLDAGATVMACPGCLKAAGKSGDDLMPGVKLADKDAFFNFTDGRILTLDY